MSRPPQLAAWSLPCSAASKASRMFLIKSRLPRIGKPADLPVEMATKFDLVTAKAQSLNDVARLVNLTALDRRGTAEGSADHLGQGLSAVNDE